MKKEKNKHKLGKILINIFELIFLIILIAVIVYLIKSENGIMGRMNQKTAGEKLDAAINNFTSTDTDRDLEEFIREIEGLEEIEVNRDAGTIELTIDGHGFLVVVSGTDPTEEDIHVEDLEEENNDKEQKEEGVENSEQEKQN